MPTLSLHRPLHDQPGHPITRIALPLAGVIAGTVAGFVAAAAVRRSGVLGPEWVELSPSDGVLEIDKGGIRVVASRDAGTAGDTGTGDLETGEVGAGGLEVGEGASLASAGVRPTFDVEAELEREVASEPEPSGQSQPGAPRKPELSAPRA